AIEREGSITAFAKRHGLHRTDVNNILNGRRPVTSSLVKALGLRKVYAAVQWRRFPPPWSVEELDACSVVPDVNAQALAHVYWTTTHTADIEIVRSEKPALHVFH